MTLLAVVVVGAIAGHSAWLLAVERVASQPLPIDPVSEQVVVTGLANLQGEIDTAPARRSTGVAAGAAAIAIGLSGWLWTGATTNLVLIGAAAVLIVLAVGVAVGGMFRRRDPGAVGDVVPLADDTLFTVPSLRQAFRDTTHPKIPDSGFGDPVLDRAATGDRRALAQVINFLTRLAEERRYGIGLRLTGDDNIPLVRDRLMSPQWSVATAILGVVCAALVAHVHATLGPLPALVVGIVTTASLVIGIIDIATLRIDRATIVPALVVAWSVALVDDASIDGLVATAGVLVLLGAATGGHMLIGRGLVLGGSDFLVVALVGAAAAVTGVIWLPALTVVVALAVRGLAAFVINLTRSAPPRIATGPYLVGAWAVLQTVTVA